MKKAIKTTLKLHEVKGRTHAAQVIEKAMTGEGRKRENFYAACKELGLCATPLWRTFVEVR